MKTKIFGGLLVAIILISLCWGFMKATTNGWTLTARTVNGIEAVSCNDPFTCVIGNGIALGLGLFALWTIALVATLFIGWVIPSK